MVRAVIDKKKKRGSRTDGDTNLVDDDGEMEKEEEEEEEEEEEWTAVLVDDVLRAVNTSSSLNATVNQLSGGQLRPLPLMSMFSAARHVLEEGSLYQQHHHRRRLGNAIATTTSTGAVRAPAPALAPGLALTLDLPGVIGHEDIKVAPITETSLYYCLNSATIKPRVSSNSYYLNPHRVLSSLPAECVDRNIVVAQTAGHIKTASNAIADVIVKRPSPREARCSLLCGRERCDALRASGHRQGACVAALPTSTYPLTLIHIPSNTPYRQARRCSLRPVRLLCGVRCSSYDSQTWSGLR